MQQKKTSRLIPALGWLHVYLLSLCLIALMGHCMGLEGQGLYALYAISLLLFLPIVTGYLLLRAVRYMFPYVMIGLAEAAGVSAASALLCQAMARTGSEAYTPLGHYVGAVGISLAVLSLFPFLCHISGRVKHGTMKKDFEAAHLGMDVPFELQRWEVPTFATQPHPAFFLWFTLWYLIGVLIGAREMWHTILLAAALEVLVIFLFDYLTSFEDYILQNQRTANLPYRAMSRVHKRMMGSLFALLILLLLPILILGDEPLAYLKEPESAAISIDLESNDDPPAARTGMDYEVISEDDPRAIVEEIKPHPWLGKLILGILFLMIAFGAIMAVISIIRSLRRAAHEFELDEEDQIIDLDEESDSSSHLRHGSAEDDSYFSERMKIRRRYRKLIRRSTKGAIDVHATPTELEVNASLSEDASTQELHTQYEKARYDR